MGGKMMDLYTGLSAGLLRQAVYTTARIGFFETFMKALGKRADEQGRKIGFKERASAGLMAGGLAAMAGNPADLAQWFSNSPPSPGTERQADTVRTSHLCILR